MFRKYLSFLFVLFCVVTPRVWASNDPVLVFYISNSGIMATIGGSESPDPYYIYSMETSSDHTMIADPPSLFFTDSPLKFFHHFTDRYGHRINQAISARHPYRAPITIYIGAAGASKIEEKILPEKQKVQPYLENHLNGKGDNCYTKSKNKKEFFICMFQLDIERFVEVKKIILEQDVDLITTMGVSYLKDQQLPTDNILLLHATTLGAPIHLENEKIKPFRSTKLTDKKTGGAFQAGEIFKNEYVMPVMTSKEMQPIVDKFKADLEQRKEKPTQIVQVDKMDFETALLKTERSDLLGAVYASDILHKACYSTKNIDYYFEGAPYMLCRLATRGAGCVFFGDLALGVACDQLHAPFARSCSTVIAFDQSKAKADADKIVCTLCDEHLNLLSLAYLDVYDPTVDSGATRKAPQMIIVGERTGIFESFAKQRSPSTHYTYADWLKNLFQSDEYKLQLQARLKDAGFFDDGDDSEQSFAAWFDHAMAPAVDTIEVLPYEKFPHYLHKSAVHRLQKNI